PPTAQALGRTRADGLTPRRPGDDAGARAVLTGDEVAQPTHHRHRPAVRLALDELRRSGDLVGRGDDGDPQLTSVTVPASAVVLQRHDTGRTDRDVRHALTPRPPAGVGDDDSGPPPEPRVQA